jgi:hypothetical protein
MFVMVKVLPPPSLLLIFAEQKWRKFSELISYIPRPTIYINVQTLLGQAPT